MLRLGRCDSFMCKVCPDCGKSFKNYRSYNTHHYRFHNDNGLWGDWIDV